MVRRNFSRLHTKCPEQLRASDGYYLQRNIKLLSIYFAIAVFEFRFVGASDVGPRQQ